MNEYTLTPDELGMIAPLIEQIKALQDEVQPLLRAIRRLRKLEGDGWKLDGNKLTRTP